VNAAHLPQAPFSPLAITGAEERPEWSVVTTMFRSRPYLDRFIDETMLALRAVDARDFEIVLVNDGSPDDSLAYALKRQRDCPHIVVVDLSRNFGHHHAMQAGLRVARGERIFLIDCDLEVEPAALVSFARKQEATGADMVFGYQESRKGGWFERISGAVFWKGFNVLSDTKIPENILTERVMTRRFVDALLSLGDHNVFLGGMMSWTGFQQIGLPVPKEQRHGKSTYSLLKRVQLMVNAVSSFSARPLTWMFNIGIAMTLVSFSYIGYLLMRKLLFGDALLGFTSMMGMLAMTLGVLTTGLGLIGIYLGKVFTQVQARPNYIIRDVHRAHASARMTSVPSRARDIKVAGERR
jgi:putative glycosyltransferase